MDGRSKCVCLCILFGCEKVVANAGSLVPNHGKL